MLWVQMEGGCVSVSMFDTLRKITLYEPFCISYFLTMATGQLFVSFILVLINTGFSAGDIVYVETGASVQLDIQRDQLPDEFDELFWENEKTKTIVKYYNDSKKVKQFDPRVDFNIKTFSLTLKNMQKTDDGVYTAKITGETNRDITKHRISVIDPVESPVLTVISNWSSSDQCIVNVTCTGHNLTVNSSYNNGRCSPEEVTSHKNYTLTLICSEEFIICNHSNPVSWKTDKTEIKQLCTEIAEEQAESSTAPNWMIGSICGGIFGGIAVLVVVGILACCYCWRKHKGVQQEVITVYEGVQNQPMETFKGEPHTYDTPDRTQEKKKGNETNTIYHLVGQPANPPVTVTAVTDNTIYSQVFKVPAKTPDANSSDNTGNQTEDHD